MTEKHLRFTEWEPEVDVQVQDLQAQMTLEEKIGQMVQVHMDT
jgi:hypothetical protein